LPRPPLHRCCTSADDPANGLSARSSIIGLSRTKPAPGRARLAFRGQRSPRCAERMRDSEASVCNDAETSVGPRGRWSASLRPSSLRGSSGSI
jgi:hypothetical protein